MDSTSVVPGHSRRAGLLAAPPHILAIGAALLLAGCASVIGPRQVELPLEKLQASLGAKFPIRQRYLELLDVTVSNPRLQLLPDTNRITATMDASIAPVFIKKTYGGTFTLSGMLAIDNVRHAVVLRAPQMERLTLDGVDDKLTGQLANVSGLLAQQILGDVAVYVFEPEQLRYAGVQFTPTRITTTARSLMVTFEPNK